MKDFYSSLIMAVALRCLSRTTRFNVLKRATDNYSVAPAPSHINSSIQVRSFYYDPRKIYPEPKNANVTEIDLSKLPEFEVSKDAAEWEYVERLIPPLTVPPLKKGIEGPMPSGFVPPREEGKTHPYFVSRTKNHMLPVYLELSFRGSRQITVVRNIDGNIWKLEEDLRKYLEERETKKYTKHIAAKVNEMARHIKFRGDYVNLTKKWMESKGF